MPRRLPASLRQAPGHSGLRVFLFEWRPDTRRIVAGAAAAA